MIGSDSNWTKPRSGPFSWTRVLLREYFAQSTRLGYGLLMTLHMAKQ